jgi:hypothetical protein
MVSLMTALVRKCNSRIVRSFMCYIVTHNWTERQFVKIIYLNTEYGINRVAIRSTLTPGAITVTATREAHTPATVKIESKPVEITSGLMRALPPTLSGPRGPVM